MSALIRPKPGAKRALLPISAIVTFVYAVLLWASVFFIRNIFIPVFHRSPSGEIESVEIVLPPFSDLHETLSFLNILLAGFVLLEISGHWFEVRRRLAYWISAAFSLILIGLLQVVAQRIGSGDLL